MAEVTRRQREEWEVTARALKADGYNAGVVTRKMITQHGMSEPDAEALVGGLFGKKVSARTGDTTAAVLGGLGLAAAGLTAAGLTFWFVGLSPPVVLLAYAAMLGAAGKGAASAFMAVVNAGVKEDLVKKKD